MRVPSLPVAAGVVALVAMLCSIFATGAAADEGSLQTLPLDSMDAFEDPPAAWSLAGEVYADHPAKPLHVAGEAGVLIYDGAEAATLLSRSEHGDARLEIEFMLEHDAEAAVLLQNRYELRLRARRPAHPPKVRDHGGVVYGAAESAGLPPRLDASRAPGVWQHLAIEFQAPRFDEAGEKIANARLRRVVLNGATIHRSVELPSPSPDAELSAEAEVGPIALRGERGRVAFRAIGYQRHDDATASAGAGSGQTPDLSPIPVEPDERAVVQRSYAEHEGDTRQDGVFVGDPSRVHYSFDLDQGALLHVWRGPFLDLAPVWTGRGMDAERLIARAKILGSTVTFSGRPTAAFLADGDAPWPDVLDGYELKGYRLDEHGRPTFRYRLGEAEIHERVRPAANGQGLARTITLAGESGSAVWLLLADGERIEPREEGWFSVDDELFVEVSADAAPVVRRVDDRDELIVPVHLSPDEAAVQATMIW